MSPRAVSLAPDEPGTVFYREAPPQMIFDFVAHHLLSQREQSLNNADECEYHRKDGIKCAIGCAIPDARYSRALEGISLSAVLDKMHGHMESTKGSQRYILLLSLQRIHDLDFIRSTMRRRFLNEELVKVWVRKLRALAELFDLSASVVDSMEHRANPTGS